MNRDQTKYETFINGAMNHRREVRKKGLALLVSELGQADSMLAQVANVSGFLELLPPPPSVSKRDWEKTKTALATLDAEIAKGRWHEILEPTGLSPL